MYSSLTFGLALSFISVYILYYYIENRVQAAGIDLRGRNPHYLIMLSNIGGISGCLILNYRADRYEFSNLVDYKFQYNLANTEPRSHPILRLSIFIFISGAIIFA